MIIFYQLIILLTRFCNQFIIYVIEYNFELLLTIMLFVAQPTGLPVGIGE